MADKPFPILFIASTQLGDEVLASGLVKRLHDEVPQAQFTVVAGEKTAPLFADVPGLERTIVLDETGLMAGFRLWSMTRGRLWGVVVDPSLRGTKASRRLPAPAAARAVLHPTAPQPFAKVIAGRAGCYGWRGDPARALSIRRAGRRGGRPRAPHPPVGGPSLAIAPGADWVGKTWPAERFASVAARLLSPGGPLAAGRLMILGDSDAREAGRAVKLAVTRARIIAEPGQIDPLATYACLKHARLAIGNDSGAMQLAAAAGVPTLALFGPSDERVNWPLLGPQAQVLRWAARILEAFRRLDPDLEQAVCHMLDLSVDTVVEAARRLLAETEPKQG